MKPAQYKLISLLFILILLAAGLPGCQGPVTPAASVTPTHTTASLPTPTATPTETAAPVFPADTPTPGPPTETPPIEPIPTQPEPTATAAPGTATPTSEAAAPTLDPANPYLLQQSTPLAAEVTPLNPYSPPVATLTPVATIANPPAIATNTPRPAPTAASTEEPTSAGSPTPAPAPTEGSLPTPTERISQPLGTPSSSTGTVTIWHSWDAERADMLMLLVAHFQDSFPDVRFDISYVPPSDLLYRYEALSYLGGGPSLLLGPSDWTAYLVDRQLVEDLTPYASAAFLATLNPAAVGAGRYQGQLACLPLGASGALLYRNRLVIPAPADSFETLLANAEAATQAGTVGAYLERGFSLSFAHLYGLGGQVLDENGAPAFQQDDYRYSLAWVNLLNDFLRPGAASLNTEDDTNVFMQGRAGYIIDGSWNLNALADAIGADNLLIDPWPTAQTGRLSGYVKAESVYLNVNTAGQSAEDHLASLRFMGYLMVPQVQTYLAEVGLIPSALAARPRQLLQQQAMQALAGGTAYPAVLLSQDGALRPVYQDALNAALEDIFEQGEAPRRALENALQVINQRLDEIK